MIDFKKVKISIHSFEPDKEFLQELTINLREDIENLEVEEIISPDNASQQPDKTKSADAITWGQLLITLAASGGVITTLIVSIKEWVLRQKDCMIKIELDGDTLELKGIDSESQKKII